MHFFLLLHFFIVCKIGQNDIFVCSSVIFIVLLGQVFKYLFYYPSGFYNPALFLYIKYLALFDIYFQLSLDSFT